MYVYETKQDELNGLRNTYRTYMRLDVHGFRSLLDRDERIDQLYSEVERCEWNHHISIQDLTSHLLNDL